MSYWRGVVKLMPELRAYARSVASNPEEAEDLVSDAIERSANAAQCPQALDELRPWLFRVIRNLYIDEKRKQKVRLEYSATAVRLSEGLVETGSKAEETVLLRTAFEQLSSQEREVLFLVDIMGMKYAEAAAIIEVPTGTIMSRISRARKALLELVNPLQATEEEAKTGKEKLYL
ncbi:sigma-70 family RNA polymerase sigma factor [Rhodobacteraceae bacterium RKSG542]|nr:sigma-70 family RNA polymerase sigma factor [Pseudovibrio flavus]